MSTTQIEQPAHGSLEIGGIEDLVIHDSSDGSYTDFAEMWTEEAKQPEGLDATFDGIIDDVEQDVNGYDITEEHDLEMDTDSEFDFDSDDIDSELEAVAEQSAEEQLEANLENYTEFAQSFESLPDDLSFTVGDKTISKADLVQLTKADETIAHLSQALEEQMQKDNAIATQFETQFFVAQSETSKELQAIQQQLRDPYVPEMQKGALVTQMHQLQHRKQVLDQEAIKFAEGKAQRLANQQEAKINAVSAQLSKKYSDDAIADVVGYAQQQGMSIQDIRSNASMAFFEGMMKAKQYDELMAKSKSNIKAKAKPARSVNPSARKKAPTKKASMKNVDFEKIDPRNMGDLFNYLED